MCTAGARAARITVRPDSHILGLARLAARFTRYQVKYCAIGGFATAMYLPGRRPDDLDLIIDPSPQSAERAHIAVCSLALDRRARVVQSTALTTPEYLADGDQLAIPTAFGTLHIIGAQLPVGCDRAAIVSCRHWFVQGRYPVAVCGLDDLLRIKQAARHKHDEMDVAQLLATYRPSGPSRRSWHRRCG